MGTERLAHPRASMAYQVIRSLQTRLVAGTTKPARPGAGQDPERTAVMPSQPRRRSRVGPVVIALAAAFAVLIGVVPGTVPTAAAATLVGYDLSWPNCSAVHPDGTVLSVVGITGGKAFTDNPCFRSEYLAARQRGLVRFYMNLNAPNGTIGMSGPAGRCSRTNWSCQAFNYGYRAAAAAWAYAAKEIGVAPLQTRWWLDIESTNSWSSRTALNARVIAGALTYLTMRQNGRSIHANRVGVYSTNYQWHTIAGTYRPTYAAVWYATVYRSVLTAARYCRPPYAFTGGAVAMVQYLPGGIDRDYICP